MSNSFGNNAVYPTVVNPTTIDNVQLPPNEYTATQGQDTFSFDVRGNPSSVFVGGIRLSNTDWSTDNNNVVLNTPVDAGEIVVIDYK